jgi:hypothetical protein
LPVSTMSPAYGRLALEALADALEAEKARPVPRASHAVAVDVDHLCLLLDYVAAAVTAIRRGRVPDPMSGDTAVAWQMLEASVTGYARTAA